MGSKAALFVAPALVVVGVALFAFLHAGTSSGRESPQEIVRSASSLQAIPHEGRSASSPSKWSESGQLSALASRLDSLQDKDDVVLSSLEGLREELKALRETVARLERSIASDPDPSQSPRSLEEPISAEQWSAMMELGATRVVLDAVAYNRHWVLTWLKQHEARAADPEVAVEDQEIATAHAEQMRKALEALNDVRDLGALNDWQSKYDTIPPKN